MSLFLVNIQSNLLALPDEPPVAPVAASAGTKVTV